MTLTHSTLRRSLIGFIVAPPMGAAAYSAVFAIAWYGSRIAARDAEILAGLIGIPIVSLLGGFFGSPLAYFGMLIVGLPSWLLLRYINKESGLAYALLGLIGGGAVTPKIWGGSGSILGEPWRTHGAIAGVIILSIFWKIARKNPAIAS